MYLGQCFGTSNFSRVSRSLHIIMIVNDYIDESKVPVGDLMDK